MGLLWGRLTSFTGFSPTHPNEMRERKRVGEEPGKEVSGGLILTQLTSVITEQSLTFQVTLYRQILARELNNYAVL